MGAEGGVISRWADYGLLLFFYFFGGSPVISYPPHSAWTRIRHGLFW